MECYDGQWLEIIIDCAEDMGVPCEGGLYIPPEDGECCSECILFGDINDPDSEISKKLNKYKTTEVRSDLGLNTAVRYRGI